MNAIADKNASRSQSIRKRECPETRSWKIFRRLYVYNRKLFKLIIYSPVCVFYFRIDDGLEYWIYIYVFFIYIYFILFWNSQFISRIKYHVWHTESNGSLLAARDLRTESWDCLLLVFRIEFQASDNFIVRVYNLRQKRRVGAF
jgi:cellulose synthase/poly-beta-1,6-N-acetylglucosamine synthase-like glycosyltransferase